MNESQMDCPICGTESGPIAHGVIAPFISNLSGLPLEGRTTLRSCATCDLTFFDSRYGDQELAQLYENYRDASYSSIRRHWEPWYSAKVNDAYVSGSRHVDERRLFMMDVLDAAGMRPQLGCVVDFGGDEGQFFPDAATERRIVCDLSRHELPSGVERIGALSELGSTKPDLVIIAHVLEHLPDPLASLLEIRRAIADDGVLYVEVPLDRFRVKSFHSSIRYRRYLDYQVRHRRQFVAADFLTGVSRQYRTAIPRFGVVKQSEHINYFSERSVAAVLAASGFNVVATRSNANAKTGGLRVGAYGAAARPVLEFQLP
jgi:SAM-dependent methyltransferase